MPCPQRNVGPCSVRHRDTLSPGTPFDVSRPEMLTVPSPRSIAQQDRAQLEPRLTWGGPPVGVAPSPRRPREHRMAPSPSLDIQVTLC